MNDYHVVWVPLFRPPHRVGIAFADGDPTWGMRELAAAKAYVTELTRLGVPYDHPHAPTPPTCVATVLGPPGTALEALRAAGVEVHVERPSGAGGQ